MGAVSPAFLATTLGAALAIRLLGERVPRAWLLLAASVLFILAAAGDVVATLPFWVLVFGGFLAVRCARLATRPAVLLALVALVVLAWWWLRTVAPALLGYTPAGIAVVGLSYAMFRIIHLTVDARDDELGQPLGLGTYLCYLTFFPNYLAGPVQRFQHFAPQLAPAAPPVDARAWRAAVRRALSGLFKCTVLAGVALALHQMSVDATRGQPAATTLALLLAGASLAYAATLYFSFAGYMDLAISAGQVLGVTVPENFDDPLRSRNFLDLWSRWHITLSDWFRFYVFNPSLKAMLETCTRPGLAPYLGAAGYFLAFFLMGIWHGRTPALVLYGFVLGLGVSMNKLWQVWIAQRLGRRGYAALTGRDGYQVAAQAMALAYFVLALGFVWQAPPDVTQVGGWAPAGAALLVLAACLALAAASRLPGITRASPGKGLDLLLASLQAMAAAGYLWWTEGAVPELLYQWL